MTAMFPISRLGFGAWAMGGAGWSYTGDGARDETSLAAARRALEDGVTWVDTAPTYGQGHSEELIGRLCRQLGGARPLVFTKCGRHWDTPNANPYSDLRPAAIRRDVEGSLRRLGLDCLDLVQIHWPEPPGGTEIEDAWAGMLRLVEAGLARAAGVCNFDIGLLERCEAIGHVASLQTPLSLIVRGATDGLLDWCAAHSVCVLAYSPMQVGLLTDSFTPERVSRFASDDWRKEDPQFRGRALERNLALRDALRPIAREHSTTVAAVAVAWVLAWPQVTGAIVGATRPEQVDGWLPAMDLALTPQDMERIAEALGALG